MTIAGDGGDRRRLRADDAAVEEPATLRRRTGQDLDVARGPTHHRLDPEVFGESRSLVVDGPPTLTTMPAEGKTDPPRVDLGSDLEPGLPMLATIGGLSGAEATGGGQQLVGAGFEGAAQGLKVAKSFSFEVEQQAAASRSASEANGHDHAHVTLVETVLGIGDALGILVLDLETDTVGADHRQEIAQIIRVDS